MVNSSDDELKVMPKRAIKRGRRPGTTTARDTIRRCAASAFAASGYDGVTVRAIAAAAGVDSALVHHYFGTKQALFEAALALEELAAVAAIRSVSPPLPSASKPPVSAAAASIGERVVREFLETWDAPNARATIGGLLRSASADERTRTRLTDVIARTIVAPRSAPSTRAAACRNYAPPSSQHSSSVSLGRATFSGPNRSHRHPPKSSAEPSGRASTPRWPASTLVRARPPQLVFHRIVYIMKLRF